VNSKGRGGLSGFDQGQKPELNVELNRGLAGTLGVTVGQVAQRYVQHSPESRPGDWVDPSDETREVNVRLAPESRQRAADLEQTSARSNWTRWSTENLAAWPDRDVTQDSGRRKSPI